MIFPSPIAMLLMLFVLSTTIRMQLSGCQYRLSGEISVNSATHLSSLPVASKPLEPFKEAGERSPFLCPKVQ